jgi:hypothetical protein
LKLEGFDGTSSRDAPAFGARFGADNTGWEAFVWPWMLLKRALRHDKSTKRRRTVARLRDDILPEQPDAMICPQCLRVAFPDEL